MRRLRLNASINITILIFFILSAVSGIFLWLVFPSSGDRYLDNLQSSQDKKNEINIEFLRSSSQTWQNIHVYSAVTFVILVIFHDVLHWRWFRNLPRILRQDEKLEKRKG